MATLRQFFSDERGATAIEYGLIAGLIFLAIVSAVNNFTSRANLMYANITANMR